MSIERLALVTGGEIVSTFDNPDLVKLGTADVVEEVRYKIILIYRTNFNIADASIFLYFGLEKYR